MTTPIDNNNDFAPIIKRIDEYHTEVLRTREETIENSKMLASLGPILDDIKYTLREEKTNRAANCLRHNERIEKLEELSDRLTTTYETLVRFGAGVITVGGFVIAAWFVIEKTWHKISILLDRIFR